MEQFNNTLIVREFKVGGFEDEGLIEGFVNTQISKIDLLKELIDNSIDAKAKEIIIDIDYLTQKLTITDDGVGMDSDGISRIVNAMCKKSDNSNQIGKFGMGAKNAFGGLSDNNKIEILTKKENGNVFELIIDFPELLKSKKWTDNMIATEIENPKMTSGTKIIIHTNTTVLDIFKVSNSHNEDNMYTLKEFSITYGEYIINKQLILKIDNRIIPPFQLIHKGDNHLHNTYKIDIYVNDKKILYSYNHNPITFITKRAGYGYCKVSQLDIPNGYIHKGYFNINYSFPLTTNARLYAPPNSTSYSVYIGTQVLSQYIKDYLNNIEINIDKDKINKDNLFKMHKNIYIKRDNRVLSQITSVSQAVHCERIKLMNNIIKEIEFTSTVDEYVKFAKPDKSIAVWGKPGESNKGIEKMMLWTLETFEKQIKQHYLDDKKQQENVEKQRKIEEEKEEKSRLMMERIKEDKLKQEKAALRAQELMEEHRKSQEKSEQMQRVIESRAKKEQEKLVTELSQTINNISPSSESSNTKDDQYDMEIDLTVVHDLVEHQIFDETMRHQEDKDIAQTITRSLEEDPQSDSDISLEKEESIPDYLQLVNNKYHKNNDRHRQLMKELYYKLLDTEDMEI